MSTASAGIAADERVRPSLIYTDFKANWAGRRLPITGETAKVIIGQQQGVGAR